MVPDYQRSIELTDRCPTVPYLLLGHRRSRPPRVVAVWEGDLPGGARILPPWLFRLLEGGTLDESNPSGPLRCYPFLLAGQRALSDACVRYGRATAKLGPLPAP